MSIDDAQGVAVADPASSAAAALPGSRRARDAAVEWAGLDVFEAVSAHVRRVIDIGAAPELTGPHAALSVPRVHLVAIDDARLTRGREAVANNPQIAHRLVLHDFPFGPHLRPDNRSSVAALLDLLERIGIDSATFLSLDLNGAEHDMLPALAAILRRWQPFLHLRLHPQPRWNAAAGRHAVARLSASMDTATALADYACVYLHRPTPAQDVPWLRIAARDRRSFLQGYLLAPTQPPRRADAGGRGQATGAASPIRVMALSPVPLALPGL